MRADDFEDIMEFYTFEPKNGEEKKNTTSSVPHNNLKPLESFGPNDAKPRMIYPLIESEATTKFQLKMTKLRKQEAVDEE